MISKTTKQNKDALAVRALDPALKGEVCRAADQEPSDGRRQQAHWRFPVRRFSESQQRTDARRAAGHQRYWTCGIGATGSRIGTGTEGNNDPPD
jgi:hypothetical protein